jgi:YbbR domain-containing protein
VEQVDLPVQAATTGEPAAGYEVYSTNVNPARVRVSGPQSFVNTLDSVPTGAVDISGAKSDVVARQVPVTIPNPKVTVFNTIADVTVQIGEKRIERVFVLSVGGKRVTAVLFGPRSLVTKAKASDLKADIVKGENGDSAQITMPEPLRVATEVRKVKVD